MELLVIIRENRSLIMEWLVNVHNYVLVRWLGNIHVHCDNVIPISL